MISKLNSVSPQHDSISNKENKSESFGERKYSSESIKKFDHSLASSRVTQRVKEHARAQQAEVEQSKYHFVLLPDSTPRVCWDTLTGITLIYLAWRVPFLLAFDDLEESSADNRDTSVLGGIDRFADLLFIVDIFLNFRTAYYIDVNIVTKPRKIAINYIKTWFIFDLLGSFPLEPFTQQGLKNSFKYIRILKLFRLARMVKLIRKYMQFMYALQTWIFLGFSIHWTACVLGGLVFDLHDFPGSKKAYGYCLYMAVQTILNISSLEVSDDDDYILSSLISFIGCVLLSLAFSSTTSAFIRTSSRAVDYQQKVRSVLSDLTSLEVPEELRDRAKKYYDALWRIRRTSDRYEKQIYQDEDLSPSLRSEIALHVHKNLIAHVPLFRDCTDNCLATVVTQLRTHLYMKGEVIFYRDEPGTEMMIINKGSVFVRSKDEMSVAATLKKGSFFGEMGLLRNSVRTCTVAAAEFCELKSLSRKDAKNIFELYPVLEQRLLAEAKSRMSQNAIKSVEALGNIHEVEEKSIDIAGRMSIVFPNRSDPGAVEDEQSENAKDEMIAVNDTKVTRRSERKTSQNIEECNLSTRVSLIEASQKRIEDMMKILIAELQESKSLPKS